MEEKNNSLQSARKLPDARKDIIGFFKKELFRIKVMYLKQKKKKSEEESEDESEEESEEERAKKLIKYVKNESKDINYNLFKDYFNFVVPSTLRKKLYEIKNKKESNKLVNVIKTGLSDLKDKNKEMSEDEKTKIEQPNKILKIVEEILEFNKQNQSGKGLKILTPNQMLSRLPIFLAQLKAGNNSQKLKNEIRQLLYSLYRSKKLTKQLYKSLVDII